jgi:hypothetical protein
MKFIAVVGIHYAEHLNYNLDIITVFYILTGILVA